MLRDCFVDRAMTLKRIELRAFICLDAHGLARAVDMLVPVGQAGYDSLCRTTQRG